MGGIKPPIFLAMREVIMNENEKNQYLQEKIDYVEKLIENCSRLEQEWEDRIKEAKEVRDNYRLLIRQLLKEHKKDDN